MCEHRIIYRYDECDAPVSPALFFWVDLPMSWEMVLSTKTLLRQTQDAACLYIYYLLTLGIFHHIRPEWMANFGLLCSLVPSGNRHPPPPHLFQIKFSKFPQPELLTRQIWPHLPNFRCKFRPVTDFDLCEIMTPDPFLHLQSSLDYRFPRFIFFILSAREK